MCGRFLLATRPDIVVERFSARIPFDNWGPRFNIAPSQNCLVLQQPVPDEFIQAKWGLKWKNMPKLPPAINIRAESVRDKKGWSNSLVSRRCLIPATGFYEWRKGEKPPFHVRIKNNELFAFAGLFQYRPEENIFAFAIITVPSPGELSHIHHRAPRILSSDEEKIWLDENLAIDEGIELLFRPLQIDWDINRVSAKVNKVANDDIHLLDAEPEQEKLL